MTSKKSTSAAADAKPSRLKRREPSWSVRGEDNLPASPWSRLLVDYAWSQRPPRSASWIAGKVGMSRTTVNNWISKGETPNLGMAFAVMARLDLPLSRLVRYFREAGLEVPRLGELDESLPSSPAPVRPAQSPESATPTEAEDLDAMRARTREALARSGVPAATIESIVASLGTEIELRSSAESAQDDTSQPTSRTHEPPLSRPPHQ